MHIVRRKAGVPGREGAGAFSREEEVLADPESGFGAEHYVHFGADQLNSPHRTLWVVNAGLHNLPRAPYGGCPDGIFDSAVRTYRKDLVHLFTAMQNYTSGPIFWRDSTSVHPERWPKRTNYMDCYNNARVAQLNEVARSVIRETFGSGRASGGRRVVHIGDYFERATADVPSRENDMLHYDEVVLRELVQLTYLNYCGLNSTAFR